jgi:transducin (beta)-like 1
LVLSFLTGKLGEIKYVLEKHEAPIFAVKWNKKGDLLASASMDKTTIVWDIATGTVRQQFAFHEAPVLDVDWKDDVTFATSSGDKQIHVCQLGVTEPIKTFVGHTVSVVPFSGDRHL